MRVLVIASLLLATPAVADGLGPSPTHSPGFTTLLRHDSQSRAGGDITYFILDGDNPNDARIMRFDLHGQFVDANSGFGGYAQVPITYFSDDSGSETVLGNAELGMIFVPKLSTPDFGLAARVGLIVPSGPEGGFLDQDAFIHATGTLLRITDLYNVIPDATSLRLAASPMFRGGTFFGRVDVGIDVNLSDGDSNTNPETGFLLNIGGGVDLGSAALMGELATYRTFEDNSETLNVAAISVRGTGAVQPYGALLIPLEDDVGNTIDLGFLFGIEARLR